MPRSTSQSRNSATPAIELLLEERISSMESQLVTMRQQYDDLFAQIRSELRSEIEELRSELQSNRERRDSNEEMDASQTQVEEVDRDGVKIDDRRTRPLSSTTRQFLKRLREAMDSPASARLPDFPAPGEAPPTNESGVKLTRLDWTARHDCAANLVILDNLMRELQTQDPMRSAIRNHGRPRVKEACIDSIKKLYRLYRKEQKTPEKHGPIR